MSKLDSIHPSQQNSIIDQTGLPQEVLLHLPYIQVIGNAQVIVENFRSILCITDTEIRFSAARGLIRVDGRGLVLQQLSCRYCKICGTILEVSLE